jgi:hypothetical protein
MAAKKSLVGRLIVLRLMAKDVTRGYGTYPQYRAYEITWKKPDLAKYRKQIIVTARQLLQALKAKRPASLPLCRDWKCGEGNCGHWKLCQPEGRFGVKKWCK